MATKYKRILLKLSGEQLAGNAQFGVDPKVAKFLAREIKKAINAGCEVAIVAGGGNMVRGKQVAGNGIKEVTAHQMGILSGIINGLALADIFESEGLDSRLLSNIHVLQFAQAYSNRVAEKILNKKQVLIIAGSIARPFFTHDTGAVNLALELSCDVVLKSTKVDGVYDKDPTKHDDAKRHDELSLQHAIENPEINVMDKAALGLSMEHGMPVIIYDGFKEDNLLKIVQGKKIGTKIE